MNKASFSHWLRDNTDLKAYTVNRYANAIDIISCELEVYDLPNINLYEGAEPTFIKNILENPEFQIKNRKGNRMYSAALKHFIEYLEYCNNKKYQKILIEEEYEYKRNISRNLVNDNSSLRIVDQKENRPPYKSVENNKVWIRKPKYASDAVAASNFQCEFDNTHQYFISKSTQNNYVEAHHLIPMKHQEYFEYSLDIPANIVSLCLVCHKKLHFGLFEDKKDILDKLFHMRKDRLHISGISINLIQLHNYYS